MLFFSNFGLQFQPSYNDIKGTLTIESQHPVFKGADKLYSNNGNSIIKLGGSSDKSQILEYHNGQGIYAVYDGTLE